MSFNNCNKCGKHVNEIAKAGKYLTRVSPMGENFIGECSPCCEYHEIKADGSTALLNALSDTPVLQDKNQ